MAPRLDVAGGLVPTLSLVRVARAGAQGARQVRRGAGHRVADLLGDGAVDALESLLEREANFRDSLGLEGGHPFGGAAEVGLCAGQGGGGRGVLDLGGVQSLRVELSQERVGRRGHGASGVVLTRLGCGHRGLGLLVAVAGLTAVLLTGWGKRGPELGPLGGQLGRAALGQAGLLGPQQGGARRLVGGGVPGGRGWDRGPS